MADIIYTAQRNLVPGHVIGQQYTIPAFLTVADKTYPETRTQRVSFSGQIETVLIRIDTLWVFRATRIELDLRDDWNEFLGSVAAGEFFNIDGGSIPGGPAITRSLQRTSTDYAFERITREYFAVNFEAQAVPST